jgi:subtilisin family serine protease
MLNKKLPLIAFMIFLITPIYVSSESSLNKFDPELLSAEGTTSIVIQFSKKPNNYKQFIKSLEGEIVRDYNIIDAVAIKIDGRKIEKLLGMENVTKIYKDKKVKALLHDSAPLISADQVWNLGFTGKDVKVCVIDTGVDYKHPVIGNPNCKIADTTGNEEPYVLESPHPYPASYNYTWTITKPGYTNIAVHFVNISMEYGYDFLYIKDKNDEIVQNFTGNFKDIWSVLVLGDTIKINLVSDWYMSWYGFYIDKILNGVINYSWSNCGNIIGGYNFVNYNYDPMDDNGHGTHVTGIITSNDPYSRGIANGTKIMAAKVLDSSGSGMDSDVIAGIEWCANNNAQIISMSLGGDEFSGTCDSDILAQAVNNAANKGIPVVVAAGNGGKNGITTPACASGAIAVGATDKNNSVVGFSSKGSELDIVAPGYRINSTKPNNAFGFMSGTSMAAPHVSGVIALMLEANPILSLLEIREVLNQTSDSVNKCYECTWDSNGNCNVYGEEISCTGDVTGSGVVNAFNAVNSVLLLDPIYYNIIEPTHPSVYSPLESYNFSINWLGVIDRVIFEFNGTNYTGLEKVGNTYSKILNYLPAATFYYKWYANDTNNNWNSTYTLTFTVNKANSTVNLLLNNNDTDIILEKGSTVNIIAELVSGESRIELYQNGLLINNGTSPLTNSTNYSGVGIYNITVLYPETENYTLSSETHFITVQDTTPPIITILYPQNTTYSTTSVPLNFTVNEPASWIGYSLDNNPNITITVNTTLTGLTNGSHNIIVFANDTSGNMGSSNRVYFAVSVPSCTCTTWRRRNLLCCSNTRYPSSFFTRTCNPRGCGIEQACMSVSACAV